MGLHARSSSSSFQTVKLTVYWLIGTAEPLPLVGPRSFDRTQAPTERGRIHIRIRATDRDGISEKRHVSHMSPLFLL